MRPQDRDIQFSVIKELQAFTSGVKPVDYFFIHRQKYYNTKIF